MNQPSRREFLTQLSVAALAFRAGPLVANAGPEEPRMVFPAEPRARLAVTSYPFRELIESPTNPARSRQQPGMDLKDFPEMIAKRFGVHNINPLADHFASTEPSYLDAFRSAIGRAGSHIVDLGLGAGKFWDVDASQRAAAVDYGKRGIEIAAVVGSPSVRQHLAGSRGLKPDADLAAQSLGKLADYGAAKNVLVLLENDAAINEDPFLIVNIIEKVNSPYFRGLPDIGNSLAGGDADFNERGVTAMFKHAYNMCHVKDAVMGGDGQVHRVELPRMFAIARASGYQGYFSMEWEIRLGDPFVGTQQLVDETLKYLT